MARQEPYANSAVSPAVVPSKLPEVPLRKADTCTSPAPLPQEPTLEEGVGVELGVAGALPVAVEVAAEVGVTGGERVSVAEVLRDAPTESVLEEEAVRGLAEVARGVGVIMGGM